MLNREQLLEKYKKQIEQIEEFIETTDFEVFDNGEKVELNEDIFFFKSEYKGKEVATNNIENHRNMIDIHYAYKGKEQINICNIEELKLTEEYDTDKDVEWYDPTEVSNVQELIINEGEYVLCFPGEGHEPEIKVDSEECTKIVFKIKF